MRRTLITASLLFLATAPLAAQANHDPDKHVAGGGLPAGMMGRADGTAKVTDVKFAPAGDGYHVTSGPAGIYWSDKNKMSGPFVATITIKQTKAPTHAEAYGIFFVGSQLSSPDQTYAYLLVRGDGMVMLNHRAGSEVHKVMPWTANAAVHKADANGVSTNVLTVDASKPDSVRLKVNGVQVANYPGSGYGKDNYVGFRVNHNLDVDVSAIKITH